MNGFCKTAGFAASRRSGEAAGREDTHRTFASGRAPRSGSKTANPPFSSRVARMKADRLSAVRDDCQRVREVGRLDHPVAVWLENVPQEEPHVLVGAR